MFYIRVFLCLFTCGTSCFAQDTINQTDTLGRKQGFWRKLDPDGQKIYEGQFTDNIPAGKFVHYYQNGRVKTISFISENGKSARTTSWFPDGKLMAKGNYRDEKKDSLWQFFSDITGSLVSEEYYQDGRKNGLEKIFFPSLSLSETVMWKEGVKEGEWKQYYEDGAKKLSGSYRDNERTGSVEMFYSSGKILASGFYWEGHQDSTWTYFNEKGNITLREYYQKGILLKSEDFPDR